MSHGSSYNQRTLGGTKSAPPLTGPLVSVIPQRLAWQCSSSESTALDNKALPTPTSNDVHYFQTDTVLMYEHFL